MAALFFYAYGYNIFKTTYMSQDYTLILFMILAINIYYFGLNSFLRLRGTSIIKNEDVDSTTSSKEVILVDTVNRSIPVKVEDIAYYYILKGDVYMRTKAMSNMEESYPIQDNLRALEQKLDRRMFFRINRQMIVSFQSCLYYKPGKNKTLEVALTPAPYQNVESVPVEHARLCIVSEDRAVSFRKWMDR
ncbi:hypothetical protein GR160_07895 [Flavobacterium sp. Sd200]|uniref:LytTR family DNA-binding domain-containing protein n=1 Tax=Flavobacterium sp. Sd200 TaxID=2692211 RepID=UPI00136B1018|nr:LytTR family DNA-binding domain-containing protein [Flavobacterium sp. Sd200]MXN91151.1 hypothetical protein [Flavobacterium sp. Sd200]